MFMPQRNTSIHTYCALRSLPDAPPTPDGAAAQRLERVERLAAEQALVIESIPDPLLVFDALGGVAQANREARRQFGEQIAGRDLSTVIRHPEILASVRRALAGDPGEIGRAHL